MTEHEVQQIAKLIDAKLAEQKALSEMRVLAADAAARKAHEAMQALRTCPDDLLPP